MKRTLFLLTIFLSLSLKSFGQDIQSIDSLAKIALTHASHNNVNKLRPLYEKYGSKLPHHIQLYCLMTISRNDGQYDKMIECIDSLKAWYPKQIQKKTLLSLSELKAEGLRQLGRYDELYDYCSNELKRLQKKGLKEGLLKEIISYRSKALRLRGNTPQSVLLQKADRYLISELDSLYEIHKNQTDDFTKLRCRLSLAHAFHRSEDILEISKQLIQEHPDLLDPEELSMCIKMYADGLVHLGKWKELDEWVQYVGHINRNHAVPLDLYRTLATSLKDKPAYEIVRPSQDCTVQTTYEWPLLFKAKVNGRTDCSFTLGSEQPYTLLTEEIAELCHAEILKDTVLFSSSHGVLEVSPAWIESLAIGEIVFKNVYVYVIHGNQSPYICSVGLNELMDLRKIEILPEKIRFPYISEKENSVNGKKSLLLSMGNSLCLSASYGGEDIVLNIDFCYPNNIINQDETFVNEGKESVPIFVNGKKYDIYQPIYVATHNNLSKGFVGVPFLRNYYQCTLDFLNMTFSAEGETTYRPARGNFGHYTDKNYLQRNVEALEKGNYNNSEIPFLQQLIAIGKNNPQKVVELCRQMRLANNEFYDAHIEAEQLYLCGSYQEAYLLLKNLTTHHAADIKNEELQHLQNFQKKLHLYANVSPIAIEGQHIDFDQEGCLEELRLNNKKIKAEIDLLHPQTEISAKMARKYKVKKLGQVGKYTYGIIPSLCTDELTIKNIPCIITATNKKEISKLPDNGKGIRLGWEVLRNFKTVTFTKNGTVFSLEKAVTNKPVAKIYHDLNYWYVETEAEGTFPTYRLTKQKENTGISQDICMAGLRIPASDITPNNLDGQDESQGQLSLSYVLAKRGKAVINLEDMLLFYE